MALVARSYVGLEQVGEPYFVGTKILASKMDMLQSLKAILIRIKSGLKKMVVSIENGGVGLYLLKQNCQKNFQKESKLFDLTGKMLARANLSKMITL